VNEPPGLTEIVPLDPACPPSVRIVRDGPPADSPEVRDRWRALCDANPRYHDGPILAVVSVDRRTSEIVVRKDRYARLAVQPQVSTRVRLLGVTGVLTAHDAMGRAHVLLGRRGDQVRIYAGMWELGPSGGVNCPGGDISVLSFEDLCRALADEIEEEVGLPAPRSPRAIAIARDHRAMSDDVVIACDAGGLEGAMASMRACEWEYREAIWMPIDSLGAFDSANELIAPTRGIMRLLGWLPGA